MKKDPATPRSGPGASTDWEAIRRRLEQAEQAMTQAVAPSAEERRSILKARARALAGEAPAALDRQQSLEIIEFRLAAETYGIESAFLREVYPLKSFTPLPGTPPFVLGIINVRGEIISVVDLKRFFSLPEKGLGELNKVIIIRDQRMEFGILADAVLGARAIPLSEITPTPLTVTGIGAEYLKGVTRERMVILDARRVLGDEKIIVHQEAA